MPSFDVTAPDGKVFRVNAPEGATEDQAIAYVATDVYPKFLEANKPKPERGIGQLFTQGFGRGVAQTGVLLGDYLPAMAGRGVEAAGESLGAPGVAEFGKTFAERQLREAAQSELDIAKKYPREFQSYEDITGPLSAVRYASETLGEGLPSILPGLVTGGAGAIAARGLASAAGRTAATFGATAAGSAAQTVPEAYASLLRETGKEEIGAALVAGGINSALESILPATILSKTSGPAKEALIGSIKARLGLGVVKGGSLEFLTEGAQEAVNKAAVSFVDENKEFFTSDNWKSILDSAIRGAIVGGAVGGVTDVVAGRRAPPPEPTVESPPAGTEAPPAGTEAPPAGTEAPPTGTVAPPAGTEAPPTGTVAPPAGTEAPPAGTEAPPAGTEAPPAGTKAPPEAPQNLPVFNLPKALAGAAPAYNFGTAQFLPDFANDIDKALYITSQKEPSKADAKYREFLRQRGFDDENISYFGAEVRDFIKQKAAAAVQSEGLDTGGPLPIDFMRTKYPETYSVILSNAGLFSSPAVPAPAPLTFPKVAPPTPLVPVAPGLKPEAATVTIEKNAQKLFDTWVPGFEGVLRTLVQGLFPGVRVEIGTASGDFYGYTSPLTPSSFRVSLNPEALKEASNNPQLQKARLLKTLFHELSHNIEKAWIRAADAKTFDAIMNQYVRQRNPNATERYFLIEAFSNPALLKDPASRVQILASVGMTEAQYATFAKSKSKRLPDTGVGTVASSEVGTQYQRSFTEWVAEQGARWITKELQNLVPKTTFEKFQKSVLDRLRQLYVDVAKALGIKFKDGAFENMMRDIYGNRITTPALGVGIAQTFRPSAKAIIPYKAAKFGAYKGSEEQVLGPAVSLSENSIIGRDTEAESLAKKTPQERAVLEKIASQPAKMADHDSIIQREDRSLMGWFNQMMRSFSGALPGETLGKALLRNSVLSNLPFLERADTRNLGKFLESHQNATGRVMGVVNIGPLGYNPATKTFFYHDTATDKSLLKIFEKIGVAKMDQAQVVFLAQRELALRAAKQTGKGGTGLNLLGKDGKPLTDDQLRQMIASADKDILEASREFQKFNDKMVEMAIQSGLIPRSLGERFKTLMYTPMFRYQEDELQRNPNITLGGGIYTAIQSPDNITAFNQSVGGGGAVYADLYENILRNYNAIVSAAVRNVAYNETANVLTKLMNAGGDTTIAQLLDKPADGTITYRVNGEDRHMIINDPAMFSAVAALSPPDKNAFVRAASKVTGVLRTGVTAAPPFQLRNTIRGLVELKIKSGMSVSEIVSGFLDGVREVWSKDGAYQSIVAQTGFGGFGFGSGSKDQAAFMKRVYTSREKPLNAWNGFLRAFDKLEGLGEITEMAPRIAYYKFLKRRGMSDADATWEAVNLVNYHRHGAGNGVLGSVVSNLIPLIPFLTARIQGLYRLTETGTAGAPTSLIGKGVIGIPTAIVTRGLMVTFINAGVNMMYGDDDWYKKLSVKDRLANMYVKVGDTVIALPRAYEVGELFGGLPTLLLDSIRKENGNDIATGVGELMKKTFLVEPIPQIAKPIAELVANKNFYTGQAIESLSDKNKPKDLRFDEYTSNIAKFAGQLAPFTGLSPKQVDTLIRGYLGTSATLFLGTVDSLTSTGGTRPQGVFGDPTSFTGTVGNITGLSSILKTESQLNNKFVGDFYELKQKVTEVVTAMNEAARIGDAAAVRERLEQMPQARGLYTAFNSANARLSEINRQMDTIRRSPQFTPDRKTELLEKLRDAKGKLSQQMVEAAEKVGLTR